MSETNKLALAVEMVNTYRTRIAVIHENDHLPYSRRTVHVELTPEQMDAIKPRHLGVECGQDVCEEYGRVWLEEIES